MEPFIFFTCWFYYKMDLCVYSLKKQTKTCSVISTFQHGVVILQSFEDEYCGTFTLDMNIDIHSSCKHNILFPLHIFFMEFRLFQFHGILEKCWILMYIQISLLSDNSYWSHSLISSPCDHFHCMASKKLIVQYEEEHVRQQRKYTYIMHRT